MAIGHVANASTSQNDTSSPFDQFVAMPGAAQAGHFCFYFVVAATNIAVGTPVSGSGNAWTAAYAEQTIGTTARHRTWWKFLEAGDLGANVTSTMSATGKTGGSLRVYSGVDLADPLASIAPTITNATSSSTTTVAPAITAADFYVSFCMHKATGPTTPTNGSLSNVAGATQGGAGSPAVAGGDSTSDLDGGTTWTSTSSTGRCAVSISLKAAPERRPSGLYVSRQAVKFAA